MEANGNGHTEKEPPESVQNNTGQLKEAMGVEEDGHTDPTEPLQNKKRRLTSVWAILRENAFVVLTLLGILFGLAVGFLIRLLRPSSDALMWIGMPGELFLRLLKLVIVPLIACSVITVTASMESKASGKIGAVALAYTVITNVSGSVLGIIFCLIFQAGDHHVTADQVASKQTTVQAQDIFADLFRNIFPDNIVKATFTKTQTFYKPASQSSERLNVTSGLLSKSVTSTPGINLIGLVVISAMMGIAAGKVRSRAKVFIDFFAGATDVIVSITHFIFWFAPLGVACLTTVSIARVADVSDAFSRLGNFVLSSTLGILAFQFLLMPVVLLVVTRKNPVMFFLSITRPYLIAFATTSTAVAMPDMFEACERKNKIDRRVSRVVIPLVVALAKAGSAVYITSAVVFMAQLNEQSVGGGDLVLIGVLVTFGAMAIPAVPSSSIVTVVVILTSLNVPSDDVALLFAVEWFLDRMRTSCNVVGQTSCAVVTSRFCRKELTLTDDEDVTDDAASGLLT